MANAGSMKFNDCLIMQKCIKNCWHKRAKRRPRIRPCNGCQTVYRRLSRTYAFEMCKSCSNTGSCADTWLSHCSLGPSPAVRLATPTLHPWTLAANLNEDKVSPRCLVHGDTFTNIRAFELPPRESLSS